MSRAGSYSRREAAAAQDAGGEGKEDEMTNKMDSAPLTDAEIAAIEAFLSQVPDFEIMSAHIYVEDGSDEYVPGEPKYSELIDWLNASHKRERRLLAALKQARAENAELRRLNMPWLVKGAGIWKQPPVQNLTPEVEACNREYLEGAQPFHVGQRVRLRDIFWEEGRRSIEGEIKSIEIANG
ncbi:MAG: hypothetical protein EPO08_12950, partial [Rhodospirillaceae bacterium]